MGKRVLISAIIDYGEDYKELDIVCSNYYLSLEEQEYILHDDLDWLYNE